MVISMGIVNQIIKFTVRFMTGLEVRVLHFNSYYTLIVLHCNSITL